MQYNCVNEIDPHSWATPGGRDLHEASHTDTLTLGIILLHAEVRKLPGCKRGMAGAADAKKLQEGGLQKETHPDDSTIGDVFLEGCVVLWNRSNVVVVLGRHDFVGCVECE